MISRVYQPSEALKVKPRIRNHITVTVAGTYMAPLTHKALAWRRARRQARAARRTDGGWRARRDERLVLNLPVCLAFNGS